MDDKLVPKLGTVNTKCLECGKIMDEGNGCDVEMYVEVGVPRLKFGEETRFGNIDDFRFCPDCNVAPGQFHHPGCDWEECPKCHRQAIGCECGG